jgi:penicillin amidase
VRTALAAVVLGAGALVAARPVGPLPALGPLLDPTRGVWAAARTGDASASAAVAIPGLRGPVEVRVDDRGVPHIFAADEEDAYAALGYVVARDRLLQLHVQTLAASGRLTELAGARALPLDREMRGLGLPRAAERKLAAIGDTSRSARILQAYAAGINAWIDGLGPGDLPVEFKLLGTRPARWTPVSSVHLANRMGYTLAYIAPELERAAAAARVGDSAAAALFPAAQPVVEPIQPNGARAPRVDPVRLPPPGAPSAPAARTAALGRAFFPLRPTGGAAAERPSMASNNWAVAPARSATGHALLAGDPHLELTLPSIWYEAHLVVPGRLDTYGVTIPGLPAIVIGFNRDVAWTFTNTGADVIDFFAEEVDDGARPTRYRVDGAWRPIERRVETYRDGGAATVAADTLLFTHRGPLRRDPTAPPGAARRWVSMRWTVLEAADPLGAFRDANGARSARELLDAFARSYEAPAQNMLAADRGGTIGIRSTGRFPVRAGDGSGMVVRDGRTGANDWRGYLPVERWPQAFAPSQGFLASANQQPIDPGATRDYWGGDYDPWRALRINALLRADSSVTVDDMRRWQTDPASERANLFAPHFLGAAERVLARAGAAGSDSARGALREGARLLAAWNRRYDTTSTRAVLFEEAMRAATDALWDELDDPRRPPAPGAGDPAWLRRPRRVATPDAALLAALLRDSANVWWDVRATVERREDRDDVLAGALGTAYATLRRRYGAPDGGEWVWARRRHVNVRHLLQLPAFSRLDLPARGGPGTLSPSFGNGGHGASWRMVVELGPEVRGWGTYPGGQSGDPASPRYADRLPRWLAGELDPLRFPRRPVDLPTAQTTQVLTLTPAR